mgnify:CR=1 FL=1
MAYDDYSGSTSDEDFFSNVNNGPQDWGSSNNDLNYNINDQQPQFQTQPAFGNDPNQFEFNSNISNIPEDGWLQNGTNWGNVDQQLGTSFNSPMQQMYDMTQTSLPNMGGKGMDILGSIFKGGAGVLGQSQGQQNNTNQMLKGLASIWAANQEKKAQGQYGQQATQAAQQMQQNTNPFAAQRPRYQQELASVQDRLNQFRSNPQANAQYKTLQDQLIMQANRGSRQRGTSDVQMAAALAPQLTKSQMDFEKQMIQDRAGLYQPAGAGLNGQSGILEALLGGSKASTMADSNAGYASAIGRMLQGDSNSTAKDAAYQQLVEQLMAARSQ